MTRSRGAKLWEPVAGISWCLDGEGNRKAQLPNPFQLIRTALRSPI